jgi:MFS family permease
VLFPLYEIASLEGLMHGLYLLWWVQEKHVSAAAVGAVLAAGDLLLMALEMPTGWFADRVGHRCSLVVGSLLQVAGMVCCWIGSGVAGVLAASLLVALGDAFRSGADHALLYRTCVAIDREHDYQPLEARYRAIQLVALVGLTLIGGAVVVTFGFAAGWIAETALCAVGAGLAWAMVEPPAAPVVRSSSSAAWPLTRGRISGAALGVILAAGLVAALSSGAAFFVQTGGDATARGTTTIVALLTLIEAAGAALASRLPPTGLRTQLLLAFSSLAVVAVMIAAPGTAFAGVLALSLLLGVAEPLRDACVQRMATDGVRARAASLASACDKALMIASLPLAGWWRACRPRR